MNFCIITTINPVTEAVKKWHELFGDRLIVVGDKKTPSDWHYKDVTYIPFVEKEGWFEGYDPTNHYARKNIGYLEAIRRGATSIYSTDDDNYPKDNWNARNSEIIAYVSIKGGWFNVYNLCEPDTFPIWPRGFPINQLQEIATGCMTSIEIRTSSIQQGLADGEADVDAIWRLIFNKKVIFKGNKSIFLRQKTWCPFNSQATHFFTKAFPLIYLPVTVSFRMTDIFGSFVAQRCLWEIGDGVTFHSPSEVFQDRNEHDLLKDFEDEIPGYLNSDKIVKILEGLILKQGEENICENMITCYRALADENIVIELEMRCLNSWIKQYKQITCKA